MYIHCCLLLGKIAASAALFKDDYPVVMAAFDVNMNYQNEIDPTYPKFWLPKDKDRRKTAASGHNLRRDCKNLFSFYRNFFIAANLPVDEEIEICGKANTTKMKNATKAIRAMKGSEAAQAAAAAAPPRRKRIIINDVDQSANANHTEYPWTVYIRFIASEYIYYDNTATGASLVMPFSYILGDCTGMIIHRHFILTSGHCIESRNVAVYHNVALKSPLHREHNYYKDMYLQKLATTMATDGITVTGVFSNLVNLTIYYGPISIDSNTGDATNLDPNHVPITIDGSNVEVHGGYIQQEEYLDMYYARQGGDTQDQPINEPPTSWSTNDAAIIYLPPGKELTFTEKVRPVCLPAQSRLPQLHRKTNFKRCSIRYGEEFHIAGYGIVQENPIKRSTGLSRLRAKVRDIDFHGWSYYGSNLIGVPRSFQFRNMSRKLKQEMQEALGSGEAGVVALRAQEKMKTDIQKGQHDKLISPEVGDSGAPWLVQRYHLPKKYNPEDTRIFSMAILSGGYLQAFPKKIRIVGTETLLLGRWIIDAMTFMATRNHVPQWWAQGEAFEEAVRQANEQAGGQAGGQAAGQAAGQPLRPRKRPVNKRKKGKRTRKGGGNGK